MIPKIIHYCWFGKGPMPEIANECIESWKHFLPDYTIKLWNEDNFDINICTYTSEAYQAKKYAFVSDYARFWILYNYGGIYFDTDVKLLANPAAIISNGPFMGLEENGDSNILGPRCNPGVGMGAEKGMTLLKDLIDQYNGYRFISPEDRSLNLKTIVEYTTEYLCKRGLPKSIDSVIECAGFKIYPKEFFSPRSSDGSKTIITPQTVSIHLFTNTWGSKSIKDKIIIKFKSILLKYILPSYLVRKKLETNRMRREAYLKKNYIVDKDV